MFTIVTFTSPPLEEPYSGDSYHDLTCTLAVSYRPISALNLIGRWSRGFLAPNLNDAVVLKVSSSGVDVPTPGLRPEYGNSFEIGGKVRSTRFDGSLFGFYSQLGDFIARKPGVYQGRTFFDENGNGVQDDDEFGIYQNCNVERSRIYGFEFENSLRIGSLWEMRTNCFWTWGENQTDQKPLSRIPPLMGMVAVRLQPTAFFWIEFFSRMAGAQRRLSSRDRDDSRIAADGTPSWVTFNLRSRVSMEKITVNITLVNLNDATYKEHGSGIHSAGRSVNISLSYGLP
ncbi:MAG: TonB-dependent receptor [candidate division Zixibacteria bacterium]|nr:TonB-dependent receptor [candidate division Zixibacteria bacterium]